MIEVIDDKNSDRPIDILAAQRQIDREWLDFLNFLEMVSKKGYTPDYRLAEDLVAEVLTVLYQKDFTANHNANKPGYDVYSEDHEYAIQVSKKDDAKKVVKAYIDTMKSNEGPQFSKFIYLSLNLKKRNSSEKTFEKHFEDLGYPKEYIKFAGKFGDHIWDIGNFAKFRITKEAHLTHLLGIFARFRPHYDLGNPKPYRRHFMTTDDRPSIWDKLESQNHTNWSDYVQALKEHFHPLVVLPNFIVEGISRQGKRLFTTRHQSVYYTKDESFINEIQTGKHPENILNNALLSWGIDAVKLYKTGKRYPISSDTPADCQICNLYNFKVSNESKCGNHPLSEAYISYVKGDNITSLKLLLPLASNDDFVGCLATLNILKLQFAVYDLKEKAENSNVDYKELQHRDLDEKINRSNLFREQIKVIDHLRKRHYWDKQYFLIENMLKIKSKVKLFKYSNRSDITEIIIKVWRELYKIYRTASHNYLIQDLEFTNAMQMFKLLIESVLDVGEKMNLGSHLNIRLSNLQPYLQHIRPDELRKVIQAYPEFQFLKSDDFISDFRERVSGIQSFLEKLPQEKYSVPACKLVYNYLGNVLLFLPLVEDAETIANEIITKYLQICDDSYIRRELEDVHTSVLEKYTDILKEDLLLKSLDLYPDHWRAIEIKNTLEIPVNLDEELTMSQLYLLRDRLTSTEVDFHRTKIEEDLDKKYDARKFRNAVILNLIDPDKYKVQYIKEFARLYKIYDDRELFRYQHARHQYLMIVETLYHSNSIMTKEDIASLNIEDEYLRWVLNPFLWDYSEFNVYYISEYNSKPFFTYFSTIPELRSALQSYLKSNNDNQLRYIYFNYFI